MLKSIVLLSSGLDSTVSLAQALRESSVLLCVTFDYGQLAAASEIAHAAKICNYYGLNHCIVKLPFFNDIQNNALTGTQVKLPEPDVKDLEDADRLLKDTRDVWVANRNGVFINVAASYGEYLGCELVVTGFNKEEARSFPDNSPEFVDSINSSLNYSTLNKVRVVSYTLHLNKIEIVQLGQKLNVPFNYIWSCYRSGENMCGKCESCVRFNRAMSVLT